jgi:hypothetical protein
MVIGVTEPAGTVVTSDGDEAFAIFRVLLPATPGGATLEPPPLPPQPTATRAAMIPGTIQLLI